MLINASFLALIRIGGFHPHFTFTFAPGNKFKRIG